MSFIILFLNQYSQFWSTLVQTHEESLIGEKDKIFLLQDLLNFLQKEPKNQVWIQRNIAYNYFSYLKSRFYINTL